ncbi:MAG: c-type cytochrome [Bauldia sp.]|nr:c-type cytochrome [Bauldia sp.]
MTGFRTKALAGLGMAAAISFAAGTSFGQPAPQPAGNADLEARIAAADPDAGQVIASQCTICHTLDAGGRAVIGPNLYDIVNAPIARTPGFNYSPAMAALGAAGGTWTLELLDAFLQSPALTVIGTRMGSAGVANENDRANLIAWLRLQSPAPAEFAALPQVDPTTPVFQGYQADSGQTYYGEYCGACHGPTGGGEDGPGPPLKGPVFEANWNGRTVWELFDWTRRFMPADEPGALEDQLVARILAYVLQENGYVRGDLPFLVDREHLGTLVFRF